MKAEALIFARRLQVFDNPLEPVDEETPSETLLMTSVHIRPPTRNSRGHLNLDKEGEFLRLECFILMASSQY
jgi:hypothetical protein